MFSIITPTFNREDTLHRVFDSLKKQTFKKYHWVIIDDASTDGTELLIQTWIKKETNLEISYHKLDQNRGKPFALNYGLRFCREPFTIIADSDDSFEPTTLMDLKILWDCVDRTKKSEKIATIWTLTKDEDGNIVGEKFPSNFWQVNLEQRVLNRQKKVLGEKWHSWRTSILKKYTFFQSDNTKYIGESATWTQINKEYDFLCVNLVHRTYFNSEDGIINQKKSKLKVAKVKYYTSYYQLFNIPSWQLLRYRYYRYQAFEYMKANFLYKDEDVKLTKIKSLISIIPFSLVSVQKLLNRVI